MNAYWMTAGVGTLVTVVGGVIWTISDKQFGFILILSGLIVAILGLVMRLIQWGVDRSK